MSTDPPAGNEGITDNPPPPPKRPNRAHFDDGDTSIQRPVSSSAAPWIIAIVVGLMLVSCICLAAPAALFLGFFQVREVRRAEVNAAVAQEEVAIKVEVAKQVDAAKAILRGHAKGVADAKQAIAKDALLLKEYPPLPAPAWHGEYIKLLKERCKCDYQVIGEPNLAKEQQDEIKGWNESIQAELRRRHGETIFADLHKEAESRWRDRIQPKEKK